MKVTYIFSDGQEFDADEITTIRIPENIAEELLKIDPNFLTKK